MAGQRRAASLTGSRRPRLGDAKPVAKRAERVLQRTGQRLRAGYGLAERLLLVLDLIEKTHCLSFFLMWIVGVPNTASLADERKFLRASSHDLVVVREVAGAERAGIDGIYLGAICVEFVHHGAVITKHADRVAGALVLVNECLVTIHRGFEVAGSGFLVLGFSYPLSSWCLHCCLNYLNYSQMYQSLCWYLM